MSGVSREKGGWSQRSGLSEWCEWADWNVSGVGGRIILMLVVDKKSARYMQVAIEAPITAFVKPPQHTDVGARENAGIPC